MLTPRFDCYVRPRLSYRRTPELESSPLTICGNPTQPHFLEFINDSVDRA